MIPIEGVIPVLITPFKDDYTVNEHAMRKFVNRFIDAGVQGLFCLGTNGEFFTLTNDEKLRIIEIVVDEVKGRVPIYAGTGGISSQEVADLSARMERVGVDVLSIITPYFLPITQQELIHHYEYIAASTSLPIVLYNLPARTGIHIEPHTLSVLSQIPNIVAIKDSSGSFDNILQYIEASGPNFSVLAGSDALLLWTLLAGGKGGVSGSANVVPKIMTSIYTLWQNGEIEEAKKMQASLRPLSSVYKKATLPSVFKEAMNMLGLQAGPCRLPISPVAVELKEELRQVLHDYKQAGLLIEDVH